MQINYVIIINIFNNQFIIYIIYSQLNTVDLHFNILDIHSNLFILIHQLSPTSLSHTWIIFFSLVNHQTSALQVECIIEDIEIKRNSNPDQIYSIWDLPLIAGSQFTSLIYRILRNRFDDREPTAKILRYQRLTISQIRFFNFQ